MIEDINAEEHVNLIKHYQGVINDLDQYLKVIDAWISFSHVCKWFQYTEITTWNFFNRNAIFTEVVMNDFLIDKVDNEKTRGSFLLSSYEIKELRIMVGSDD